MSRRVNLVSGAHGRGPMKRKRKHMKSEWKIVPGAFLLWAVQACSLPAGPGAEPELMSDGTWIDMRHDQWAVGMAEEDMAGIASYELDTPGEGSASLAAAWPQGGADEVGTEDAECDTSLGVYSVSDHTEVSTGPWPGGCNWGQDIRIDYYYTSYCCSGGFAARGNPYTSRCEGDPPPSDYGMVNWSDCADDPSLCGDGHLIPEEECDDGNNDDGDGCSADCTIEAGWYCGFEGGALTGYDLTSVCEPL